MPRGFLFLPDGQADLSRVWDKSVKQTQTPVQKDTFQQGEMPPSRGRSQTLLPSSSQGSLGSAGATQPRWEGSQGRALQPPGSSEEEEQRGDGGRGHTRSKVLSRPGNGTIGACSTRCYHLGEMGLQMGLSLI